MLNPVQKIIQSKVLSLCVIGFLTFLVYTPSLSAPFKTMDDELSIMNNALLRDVGNIPELFTQSFFGGHSYYRPMVSLSFMAEYNIFKLNPVFYYINNLLIHILVAFSVFVMIGLITRKKETAFFTALLFAAHPIHWEAVTNIPGRSILLATLFTVNAFNCFCLSKHSQRSPYYYLSLLLFVFGLFSKESAFMFPALLFVFLWIKHWSSDENIKHIIKITWPFFLINLIYLVIRKNVGIVNVFFHRSFNETAMDFVTFLRSILEHLKLMVYPDHLYYDRSQAVFTSMNAEAVITLAAFALFAGLLVGFRRRIPAAVLFFLAWFGIELLPVSQIITPIKVINGHIAATDHFLYSASIGIFFCAVAAFEYLYRKNSENRKVSVNIFFFLIAGLYLFYFLTAAKQSFVSKNQIVMFEESLSVNPDNNRVRNSLALAYARAEKFNKTEEHYRETLKRDPANTHARIGLGKSLCDQGRYWGCLTEYDKARGDDTLQELLEDNIRLTHAIMIDQYQKQIAQDPENIDATYKLGVLYARDGQPNKAVHWFARAAELDPGNKMALYGAGEQSEAAGASKEAIEFYKRLVAIEDKGSRLDYLGLYRLAEIYRAQGDPKQSAEYFKKANAFKALMK